LSYDPVQVAPRGSSGAMTGFLGIDLGLSGARSAVIDRGGVLLGTGRSDVSQDSGIAERDPATWLDAVAEAVRKSLSAAGDPAIEAIGIGAMGPCPVTVDADLRPLGLAPLFSLDPRAEQFRRRMIADGIPETALGPDHVIPKLQWLEETDPDRLART